MGEPETPVERLHYQSFGPPDNEDYLAALRRVIDDAAVTHRAAAELGGLAGARLGQKQHPAFHLAAGADVLDSVLAAERAGFDAAVIGNIQDPALHECRQLCEMPVVGLLEATMATALTVGRSVVLVTTAETTIPLLWDRLQLYGFDSRVQSVRAMEGAGLAAISASFSDPPARAALTDQFREAASGAVRAGAEVVVPASGMLAAMISVDAGPDAAWDLGVDAPVLNPPWIAVAAAAQVARAYARGLSTSRRLAYRRPSPDEVDAYVRERRGHSRPLSAR